MSRETIDLTLPLEYLSILDEDGELDVDLEPDLDDETRRAMYRTMLLARRFDELLLEWQRGGRTGTTRRSKRGRLGIPSLVSATTWSVKAS